MTKKMEPKDHERLRKWYPTEIQSSSRTLWKSKIAQVWFA